MKNTFVILGALCISLSSFAASKQEISELLRLNRSALLDSQADALALDEVAEHLEAALQILENGDSGTDKNSCLEYAVNTYKASGYSSSDAMDKAGVVCKKISDLDVAKYVVSKFKASGYSSADSLDTAADLATREVRGKLKIVEFATEQYRVSGYSAADGVQKGIGVAKLVPRDGLSCLQTAHQNYKSSGYSSADAMDKAAQACR